MLSHMPVVMETSDPPRVLWQVRQDQLDSRSWTLRCVLKINDTKVPKSFGR